MVVVVELKCDSCQFNKFHPSGSWYSVAECGDDPYAYYYCSKLHWDEDPTCLGLGPDGGQGEDLLEDPWKDCEDYKERE